MATAIATPRRSYSDVLTHSPGSRKEAPYKVGELVYATVLVNSPMSDFDSSCNPKLSKKLKDQAEKAAETRRLQEEKGEIGNKTPRPCVIISTISLPKDQWEYELCLLTTFDNTAYSELPADEKRLALPVYQGEKPNECADQTRIAAFVFTPPPKPPKSDSYLIGYPITRSSSCIRGVFGDDKPVMGPEEVKRLRRYCDWIKEQKRDVLKPRPLPTKAATVASMISARLGSISRVDSPLSYESTGDTNAGPVAGPSGVSRSVEVAEATVQKPAKRSSGDRASKIIEQVLTSTGEVIKRAVDVVRRSVSPKSISPK